MFDTGVSAGVSAGVHTDDGEVMVAGLVGFSARCRVVENIARARVVESVCEIAEIRLAAADVGRGDGNNDGDPAEVMHQVVAEVAAGLGISQQVARPLLSVGLELERMPLTAVRFVCGALDWSRTQVLTSVLGSASDATISALEADAVAAAGRLGPRSLRASLWRTWMAFDRDEAATARAVAVAAERGVHVRRGGSGGSVLTAAMTDIEGAEADALIDDIAATVCPQDRRTARARRVDGLIALLHGEHTLECTCGQGEDCPRADLVGSTERRRGHLLQILIDVHTLLGLSNDPATLADGTPLDPDLARTLATDARWQALLIELARHHTADGSQRTDSDTNEDNTIGPLDEGGPDDSCGPDDGCGPDDSCGPDSGGMPPASAVPRPKLLMRGRIGAAGAIPSSAVPSSYAGLSGYRLGEVARAQLTARILAAIEADPTLATGIHPDGHGAHTTPSAGALTYRPSAQLAARVRMMYATCTHPGCEQPSTACELDHIVPFDHSDPPRGGWTIESNLHPVCKAHHQLKTARAWTVAMLSGATVLWTSRAGIRAATLPEVGCPQAPPTRPRRPRRQGFSSDIDVAAPSWWEDHMPSGAHPPTTTDLRAAVTDDERVHILTLRRHYRRHQQVLRLREQLEPPPY